VAPWHAPSPPDLTRVPPQYLPHIRWDPAGTPGIPPVQHIEPHIKPIKPIWGVIGTVHFSLGFFFIFTPIASWREPDAVLDSFWVRRRAPNWANQAPSVRSSRQAPQLARAHLASVRNDRLKAYGCLVPQIRAAVPLPRGIQRL
jgi:hypothetical protein